MLKRILEGNFGVFIELTEVCFVRLIVIVSTSVSESVQFGNLLNCKKQIIDVSFSCVCGRVYTIASRIHSYFENIITNFMINNRTDA